MTMICLTQERMHLLLVGLGVGHADAAEMVAAATRETAKAALVDHQDAERWRHCKAHGHPTIGPQCVAWTYDGRKAFGHTPEEAVDNAMAYRVQAVGAA